MVDVARDSSFLLVGNIPGEFHSADLRAFFSHFVEKGGFVSFHFRHRPEQLRRDTIPRESAAGSGDIDEAANSKPPIAKTTCCVVAVAKGLEHEFQKLYHNKNWSLPDGELLRQQVKITKLRVTSSTSLSESRGSDSIPLSVSSSAIPWRELRSLPELNPPSVMPRGNVGTPLSLFMELIRGCKLPGHVIKKLRLEFPKSRSKKRYGAVGLDYGMSVVEGSSSMEMELPHDRESGRSTETCEEGSEEEKVPSDDDHDAEEWERYEALHEDVGKQERTTERLFEEELEVVWDKGSSGLVFYTDAAYWDQQDGDFDEKCSKEDDWDVDMSGYYDSEGGDKDARDLRDMEVEKRLRVGEGSDMTKRGGMGGFEQHTKGIGSKLLKKSGWTEGSGVGMSSQGILEPLGAEGQHPHSKRGLGYRGEKLDRHVPAAKKHQASRDVVISTVYDRPDEEQDTPLRSAPPRTIKYRETLKFQDGGVLKQRLDIQSNDSTQQTY